MIRATAVLLGGLLLCLPAAVTAQARPTGHLSIFFDHFPTRDATELRARAFLEEKADVGDHVRLTASGFVEGLVADRDGRVTDAIAEPQDVSVDLRLRGVDVTAGFTRIVWGRLDELQPTDVINPLDLARFFLEGRSEARLAVPVVRARFHPGEHASLEGIYLPVFRRGRFDRLDEPSSPFNLVPGGIEVHEDMPARTFGNAQGGARLDATTGRVDWSASAYRGFRSFGIIIDHPGEKSLGSLRVPSGFLPRTPSAHFARGGPMPRSASFAGTSAAQRAFPRFTMIGADMESVAGAWGFRAEVAAFTEDAFQVADGIGIREGHSLDAGAGVDRKAGDYRVSGSVLVHHEAYDPDVRGTGGGRTDTSLILSADRSYAREKYQGRLFGVYNPASGSAFLRGIATAKLQDNLALEGSVGWFGGSGVDTIGRFSDSDFIYARLKYYF